MNYPEKSWFSIAFDLKSSVIPNIWLRVLVIMLFALGVTIAHGNNLPMNQPILGSIIPGIVLGLLLVFRTNTAYDRYWEGRKLIGLISQISRSLAKNMMIFIPENNSEDYRKKIYHIQLLIALFISIKYHLRQETVNEEIKKFISEIQYLELINVKNMPLQIIKWLTIYFDELLKKKTINELTLITWNKQIEEIFIYFGGCERIASTPIPQAYSIHLKHLLVIYCFAIPFQCVAELSWWTIPVTGIISFALLGVEAIGLEIENPFGYDYNDLPLDKIATKMIEDIQEITDSGSFNNSELWQGWVSLQQMS
ncbi:MAG: bestrophin family ion channel [Microcoleaceae cyanobacterium MO_207.B10]|nr:bestrophin family ion channel [Microcoleaceae cyanobacterium MO_207.B10]